MTLEYSRISVGVKADGANELLIQFLDNFLSHFQKLVLSNTPLFHTPF